MAAGRFIRCACGSGRTARRCCDAPGRSSDVEAARAHLSGLVVPAICMLVPCSPEELSALHERALDLPSLDAALHLPLPFPRPPEVSRLVEAVAGGRVEQIDAALPAALARTDTPAARSRLAVAVERLRDEGRIEPQVAAVALLELSTPKLRRLVSSSAVCAAAAAAGAASDVGVLAG